MEIKELLKIISSDIIVEIVDIDHKLVFRGKATDIDENYFPKTLNSTALKILKAGNNEIKILTGYL